MRRRLHGGDRVRIHGPLIEVELLNDYGTVLGPAEYQPYWIVRVEPPGWIYHPVPERSESCIDIVVPVDCLELLL